jgi:hypothetical protein
MMLQPSTFFVGVEMIFSHLRLKDSDRWSEAIALVKLASFREAFPEINDAQFLWACETWVQGATAGFHAFPTWRELMASLYRCENGLANRSWGFKADLPPLLRPSPEQLMLLPTERVSLLPAADDTQRRFSPSAEYLQWATPGGMPMALPPAENHSPDTTP